MFNFYKQQCVTLIIAGVFFIVGCSNSSLKNAEDSFIVKTDTIYINQGWEVDNLIFGESIVPDFRVFEQHKTFVFYAIRKEWSSDAYPDYCYYGSYFTFKSDSAGLSFYFRSDWGRYEVREPEVLTSMDASKSNVKFYNGITTFESTRDQVIEAFGDSFSASPYGNSISYYKEEDELVMILGFDEKNILYYVGFKKTN